MSLAPRPKLLRDLCGAIDEVRGCQRQRRLPVHGEGIAPKAGV